MKNVIICGASGMIGGEVLKACFNSDEISKVISLVRRKSNINHPKLEEIIVSDFSNLSEFQDSFINIDIAYFCIGVYTGAVDRETFRKITVDYTKEFADQLKKHSPTARICFLSGQGADRKEKSRMMFAKDKGIAENYLLSLGLGAVHIFRPGYIYPVEKRKEPNMSYTISRYLYPVINRLFPKMSVTSVHLAKAMFKIGIEGHQLDTLENTDIIAYQV